MFDKDTYFRYLKSVAIEYKNKHNNCVRIINK